MHALSRPAGIYSGDPRPDAASGEYKMNGVIHLHAVTLNKNVNCVGVLLTKQRGNECTAGRWSAGECVRFRALQTKPRAKRCVQFAFFFFPVTNSTLMIFKPVSVDFYSAGRAEGFS